MVGSARTRYARSGDLSIAYTVFGDGPLDVVFVPGFVSHLEVAMELPNLAGIAARLSSFARVVTFDKRGTGLSDRTVGLPTLAQRMDDIRAVMDAVGSERAAIIGLSEGGPAAALFAASHPERVSALVLWLSCLGAPLIERGRAAQEATAFIDQYLGEHWGDGTAARFLLCAGAPDTPALSELLGRFEQNAATPTAAQIVLRRSFDVDARPVRRAIGVPTLLVAHPDDPLMSIDLIRETAAEIAGATLVETNVAGHVSWDIHETEDMDAIEEFLTGSPHTAIANRSLVTVLYTDIVGSTERAVALGDERWRLLLDEHDALTRRELRRFQGREVNTTGDGFVAAFDGAARAVGCAQALVSDAPVLGLELRAGLHTGECETRGDDLAGITMHVGARVAALAGPGEVLVSGVVRDLVEGPGIDFESRGHHELKGLPDEWEIFALASSAAV